MKKIPGNAISYLVLIGLFISCSGPDKPYQEALEQGRMIRKASFEALSSEVKAAMESGGVEKAVSYCNIQANPLVDSLSRVYDAEVSRTSFHFRNPENRPTQREEPLLVAYKQDLLAGKDLKDTVIYYDDGVTAYYSPIVIESPLCLTCHGQPGSTLSTGNAEFIRTLYPEDRATGFQMGDLRGMWTIKLNKKSN